MFDERMKNATVLITGGTGTFGRAFLERCLETKAKEIRIFSRDEKKQYEMEKQYADYDNVTFFIGDVRDRPSVDVAMGGVDYVFHAAAMKQIPVCESFPMEAVKTNVFGSNNVIESAIQNGVKAVVCLSTDKAVYPVSTMGMTKAYMEKIALVAAAAQADTKICITRFGNLIASSGSVVPVFMRQIQDGAPITITDPSMTRFMMTVDEAIDLVVEAFMTCQSGDIIVKKSKACGIGDLAGAVAAYMNATPAYKIVGARLGERRHEALMTKEEAAFAVETEDCFVIPAERIVPGEIHTAYKSELRERMTTQELVDMIGNAKV